MVAKQALVKFRKGTPVNAKNDAFARVSAKTEEFIFTKSMEVSGETEGLYLISFPAEKVLPFS
jgi:hypothetical protein